MGGYYTAKKRLCHERTELDKKELVRRGKKIVATKKKCERERLRYIKNREKVLERQKARYQEKKEEIKEYGRKWYQKNKEKRKAQIKAYQKKPEKAANLKKKAEIWRLSNQERIKQNQFVRYHLDLERHREYARKYRKNNREKVRESSRRYKLKKKGLAITETENYRFILPVVKIG